MWGYDDTSRVTFYAGELHVSGRKIIGNIAIGNYIVEARRLLENMLLVERP